MNWPFGRYPRRSTRIEKIDSHDVTDADLERILDFWHGVGRYLGGYALVNGYLSRAARRWSGPVSILDMGCGRGDLSRSIADWAHGRGLDVRVHGADRYGRVINLARERHRGVADLTFDVRDLNDPLYLQAQQFDYVVSAHSLHREADDKTLAFLKTANRLARRGVIIVDWVRDARAAFYLSVLARFYQEEVVREEARLGVKRGFHLKEALDMRTQAGLEFAAVRLHFGYRFSIAGERALVMGTGLSPVAGLAT